MLNPIQPSWKVRESLNKRPRAEIVFEKSEINELPSIQRVKRPRKASQLAQFSVYKDQISTANSYESDAFSDVSQTEFEPHL